MSEAPPPPVRATGLRFFLVSAPVIIAVLLTLSVLALVVASWVGGTAKGEAVELRWSSACTPQWVEVARARAEGIGLGELSVTAEGDEVVLRGVLPGLEDDRTAVPALLTAPARFAVYASTELPQGEVLATEADIVSAYFQLDVSGHPFTELELTPPAAQRLADAPALVYALDGVVVDRLGGSRPFSGDKIELHPRRDTSREEIRQATDWMLLLKYGPGPCEAHGVHLSTPTR